MNFNTLNSEPVTSQTGKLAIALYPNALVDSKYGKQTWYARVVNRLSVSMSDIADDMVSNGVSYSKEEILKMWQLINNAVIVRLTEGISVDTGIGIISLSITGSFESGQAEFSKERNKIDICFRKGKRLTTIMNSLEPITTQGMQVVPEITNVIDKNSNEENCLTPGGILIIKGQNIAIAGENESVGVYFENMEDNQDFVKLTEKDFAENTSKKIICIVPQSLNKNTIYKIRLVTQYSKNGHLRTKPLETEYQNLLVY